MVGNRQAVDAVARALVVAQAWNSDEPRGADLAVEIRSINDPQPPRGGRIEDD